MTADSVDAVQTPPRTAQNTVWSIVRLSFFLGWQDVRLMYRRSVLGQFWITLSMAITFAAIGSVFGLIFQSPIVQYLPFLGCGLVFWSFMSLLVNEGAVSFIASEMFIRQLPLPPIIFFLRSIWKTVFVLLHNAVALALLLLIFPPEPSPAVFLVIPGVILGGVGMAGLALTFSILATRYRDVPQILAAVVQVLFYLTPIVWLPEALPAEARSIILGFNPFHHMMQVMRQPLLGQAPTLQEWGIAGALALVFVVVGTLTYARFRTRLAFWL